MTAKPKVDNLVEAERYFQQGLSLEETGAPIQDAMAAYEKAIDLNPNAAGALVNLGTILFPRSEAEESGDLLYAGGGGGSALSAGAFQYRQSV